MQAPPISSGSLPISHQLQHGMPVQHAGTPPSAPLMQSRTAWTDLPDDVVQQVMSWLMVREGSEAGVSALASASKALHASARMFRQGAGYAHVRASWNHARAGAWAVKYLDALRRGEFLCIGPSFHASLQRALSFMTEQNEILPAYLMLVEEGAKEWLAGESRQQFQNYRGSSLWVHSDASPWAVGKTADIADVLPRKVVMAVLIGGTQAGLAGAAALIRGVVSSGRMSGFTVVSEEGATIRLDGLAQVIDMLCAPGRVSFIRFNKLDAPDPLLAALAERCNELHSVRLISMVCEAVPDDKVLAALGDALVRRQESRKSRVTVAVHCQAGPAPGRTGGEWLSADSRAALERAGVFLLQKFGSSEREMHAKLIASVASGPPVTWGPLPLSSIDELIGDVDGSQIVSSDEDSEERPAWALRLANGEGDGSEAIDSDDGSEEPQLCDQEAQPRRRNHRSKCAIS